MKKSKFSDDLHALCVEDAELGAMSEPAQLEKEPADIHLTRRIPVRELRRKGWRTRSVDDFTESLINEWCFPVDSPLTDSLETMIFMIIFLWRKGKLPKMWKRDVRRAFRNLPVYFRHLKFMVVAWMYKQRLWTSRHTGLPFGSVGAVYGWHRFAYLYRAVLVRSL